MDDAAYQARVLEGYDQAAPELIPAYENLPTEAVLAPVLDLLPEHDARVLDVGAGPGVTAAWLAHRGHKVTAVEPAERFREHGENTYPDLDIDWQDTCLPQLAGLPKHCSEFDAALVIGMLHHLSPKDQEAAIETLSARLRLTGRLILSLRHGPCPPGRPGFPIDPDALVNTALKAGLRILHRSSSASIQQGNRRVGVTWTWLVFEKT